MLLSALFLLDCKGVNSFTESPTYSMTEGDTGNVYIQLRDNSVNPISQGFSPVGRRYVPAANATLSVSIPSLDPAKNIIKVCSQPYANDGSIWMFTLTSRDIIRGTQDLRLTLNESGKLMKGLLKSGFRVSSAS